MPENPSGFAVPRLGLRLSLVAGSLYDLVFAFLILLAPERLAPWLGIPLPEDQIYLRFLSVFLVGLAAMYLLPAWEPARYVGVIVAAILVRGLGCVFLCSAVAFYERAWVFAILGATDGMFAVAHGVGLALSKPHFSRFRAIAHKEGSG